MYSSEEENEQILQVASPAIVESSTKPIEPQLSASDAIIEIVKNPIESALAEIPFVYIKNTPRSSAKPLERQTSSK